MMIFISHSQLHSIDENGQLVKATTNKEKLAVWHTIASGMEGYGPPRTSHDLKRKKETWFSEVKAKVKIHLYIETLNSIQIYKNKITARV